MIEEKLNFGISYLDDLANFTESKAFKIYVLDNIQIYELIISKKILKKED